MRVHCLLEVKGYKEALCFGLLCCLIVFVCLLICQCNFGAESMQRVRREHVDGFMLCFVIVTTFFACTSLVDYCLH